MGEEHGARSLEEPQPSVRDAALSAVRLRALLDGMLDPVLTIDAYGTIQEASTSVRDVFGYEPEDLLGKNIALLMPEPHRSAHDGYLERYRRTGKTNILGRTREFDVVRKDGTEIVCELSVSRVDIPGQAAPLFIGSFRDVTPRKRAELALVESEQRLRAIFDQEFQFVGLLDTEGIVLEINRAALEVAGMQREDVIGSLFWETDTWAQTSQAKQRLGEAITRAASGEFIRYETEFQGLGGRPVAVDFSLKPVRDEEGRVVLLLPEGRDITHLKQAQHRETSMLRALATIGESASILAHEIKNPITAVNIALRAVAEQLGEDHQTVLEDLASRMAKLEQTMHRTLSFARPLETDSRSCDPGDLLREAVEGMRPHLEQAGVEWTLDVADGTPPVLTDAGLLGEVLSNLLRNSVEALEGGGKISLSARAGTGSFVILEVEDDGPGIPEGVRSDLFRPFFSTKARGTGLGLAVCKKIVEELGGSIGVGEGARGGARFRVKLPASM